MENAKQSDSIMPSTIKIYIVLTMREKNFPDSIHLAQIQGLVIAILVKNEFQTAESISLNLVYKE